MFLSGNRCIVTHQLFNCGVELCASLSLALCWQVTKLQGIKGTEKKKISLSALLRLSFDDFCDVCRELLFSSTQKWLEMKMTEKCCRTS